MRCAQMGARLTAPAYTSKLPPTPIEKGTPKASRFSASQYSLRGLGMPTNMMSALAAPTSSTTAADWEAAQYPS